MSVLFAVATAGTLYVASVLVALHLVRRDLSIISSPISEYAHGPYGHALTSVLAVWGLSAIVAAIAFWCTQQHSPSLCIGCLLLVLFGLGLGLSAIFPMDLPFPPSSFHPRNLTRSGALHFFGATFATAVFPVAAYCLSTASRTSPVFQSVSGLLMALAMASIAVTILFFLITPLKMEVFGIGQRIVVIIDLLWLFILSFGARF